MGNYTLSSYEPVAVEIPKPKIPQDMLDDEIRRRLEPYYEFSTVDNPKRTVKEGDYLMVTIENALMDGNPAKMFDGEDKLYKMGTGDMPKSFDDLLVGMKPGDKKGAVIGMPSALAPDGKMSKITLDVTVVNILKAVPPELTDEFVSEHFAPCKTADEFTNQVKSEFKLNPPKKDDVDFMSRALSKLVDRLEEQPSNDVVSKYGSLVDARIACALDALADHLGIELSEDEVINLMPAPTPERQLKIYQKFVDSGHKDEAYARARQMSTLNWLHDNSTIAYEGEAPVPNEEANAAADE